MGFGCVCPECGNEMASLNIDSRSYLYASGYTFFRFSCVNERCLRFKKLTILNIPLYLTDEDSTSELKEFGFH